MLVEDLDLKIRDFITETFLFGRNIALDTQDSLLASGVIDSTGVLELVEFLEQHFDLEIDDQDVTPENLDSLANLCAFVRRKASARA